MKFVESLTQQIKESPLKMSRCVQGTVLANRSLVATETVEGRLFVSSQVRAVGHSMGQ